MVDEIAKKVNAKIIDTYKATSDKKESFPKDGIHLGEDDAKVIAETVAATLKK